MTANETLWITFHCATSNATPTVFVLLPGKQPFLIRSTMQLCMTGSFVVDVQT